MEMKANAVAVVTGSSSGIGLLTALELAKHGFQVVATMRDLGRQSTLTEQAKAAGLGHRLDVRQLDVTDFDLIPKVVSDIVESHGRIDCLVNNAGFAMAGFAEDIQLPELRRQLETNFFGHTALTRAVLPTMRKQGKGHLIMVSSIAGVVAYPVLSSYSASKFALEGWTEALRTECLPLGIMVAIVEPGAFDTDIWTRNVQLGQVAASETSPNKERSRRFRDGVAKSASRRSDPGEVARLIVRIALNRKPRLRYRIGMDAHIQHLLRRLLPWKIFERLLIASTRIGQD